MVNNSEIVMGLYTLYTNVLTDSPGSVGVQLEVGVTKCMIS